MRSRIVCGFVVSSLACGSGGAGETDTSAAGSSSGHVPGTTGTPTTGAEGTGAGSTGPGDATTGESGGTTSGGTTGDASTGAMSTGAMSTGAMSTGETGDGSSGEASSGDASGGGGFCEDFVPPGCFQSGVCPPGQVCMIVDDICVSSFCDCDPQTGDIVCDPDCGGGSCVVM